MNMKNMIILIIALNSKFVYAECNPDDSTEYGMAQCRGDEFHKQEELFNKKFARVLEKNPPERRVKIIEAQKQWRKFAELHCELASSSPEGSGTATGRYNMNCMIEMLSSREDELISYVCSTYSDVEGCQSGL